MLVVDFVWESHVAFTVSLVASRICHEEFRVFMKNLECHEEVRICH